MILGPPGSHALVCGGSDGIGLAVARKLAARGARCTLLARNEGKLALALSTLENTASHQLAHDVIAVDLGDPSAVSRQLAEYLKRTGYSFDFVINNSGGPPPGLAHQTPLEDYIRGFNQHLFSFQSILLQTVEAMKAKKLGRIVNIISTSVKQPIAGLGVSNTVRGAVASWAKTLASELGPFGITVNNVLPGATSTGRLRAILENKSKREGISLDEAMVAEKKHIPLGRFASPDEVADAVLFLCSTGGGYVNGINLPVDGGRTLCL